MKMAKRMDWIDIMVHISATIDDRNDQKEEEKRNSLMAEFEFASRLTSRQGKYY